VGSLPAGAPHGAATPDFLEQFGVEVNASNMNIPGDGSRFEPLIGKPGDGASPSCAIIDEYHEHETDDLVDTMETGMGAREQPLTLIITTPARTSNRRATRCSSTSRMLEGSSNDQLFGIIYTIDEGDDWTRSRCARRIRTTTSRSRRLPPMKIREAVQSARKQNTIKTKHLNIWCTRATRG
jgi:phage terminase large subunit-like protein